MSKLSKDATSRPNKNISKEEREINSKKELLQEMNKFTSNWDSIVKTEDRKAQLQELMNNKQNMLRKS